MQTDAYAHIDRPTGGAQIAAFDDGTGLPAYAGPATIFLPSPPSSAHPTPIPTQAQWYWVKAAADGVPDASDLLSDLAGSQFWQGTGWPSLGARPVLLLPAADTLRPGMPDGCVPESLPASSACKAGVFASARRAAAYPSLYLTYLDTLSSNASMVVMPGSHDFPTRSYQATAYAMLAKFGGV
jgi:hypothetical protein